MSCLLCFVEASEDYFVKGVGATQWCDAFARQPPYGLWNTDLKGLACGQMRFAFKKLLGRRGLQIRWLLLLYALVELRAFMWLQRQSRILAGFRNSMAPQFPYAAWRQWFSATLRHEAKTRPRMLRSWIENVFWNMPLVSLPRGDVEAWLRMFLGCSVDSPCWTGSVVRQCEQHAENQVVCSLVDEFEEQLDVSFPKTSIAGTKDFIRINSMVTNHAPMTPLFEPLCVRLVRRGMRFITDLYLPAVLKMTPWRDDSTGVVYWYGNDDVATAVKAQGVGGKLPRGLVFYHGFGWGAAPYLPFLHVLQAKYRNCGPLIIAEMPGMSGLEPRDYGAMRTTPFPRADELAESAERLKARVGLQYLDAVGHSYGAIVITYVTKYAPTVFERVVILESVPFFYMTTIFWPLVFEQYSLPSILGNLLKGRLMHSMTCLALGELWHQHVIRQTVWFMEYLRWTKEEQLFDSATAAAYASRDHVACPDTAVWLSQEHPQVKVHTYSGLHGQIILPHNCRRTAEMVLDLLSQLAS